MLLSALEQLQKVELHHFASHKNMGIKSDGGGEMKQNEMGQGTIFEGIFEGIVVASDNSVLYRVSQDWLRFKASLIE